MGFQASVFSPTPLPVNCFLVTVSAAICGNLATQTRVLAQTVGNSLPVFFAQLTYGNRVFHSPGLTALHCDSLQTDDSVGPSIPKALPSKMMEGRNP